MNNKRVIGIIITVIWLVVTIVFLRIDNSSNHMKTIVVSNSKKIYYEKLYLADSTHKRIHLSKILASKPESSIKTSYGVL